MTAAAPTFRTSYRSVLLGVMAILALGMALYSAWPYLQPVPPPSIIPLNPEFVAHYGALVVHGVPGALALLLGPVQFVPYIRNRHRRVHRSVGRIYLGSVVVAACASLVATFVSVSGFSVQVPFIVLAAAWLYSLAQAYRAIRRGDVALHRVWMIRNYALTFAAVTLRIYLLSGAMLLGVMPGLRFEDVYIVAVWGSFLGNLLVSEYFIIHAIALKPASALPVQAGS